MAQIIVIALVIG